MTARRVGSRLEIKIKSPRLVFRDDIDVSIGVRIPRGLPARVHLGVGSLEVRGLERALDLELGMKEGRGTAPVSVRLGIGEVAVVLD